MFTERSKMIEGILSSILWGLSRLVEVVPFYGLLQLFLAIIAIWIAGMAYRYTVRMNIRSNINELEPIQVGNYRLVPLLHDMRWRPTVPKMTGRWIKRSRVTVQLLVYDISGQDKKMVAQEDVILNFGISEDQITDCIDTLKNEYERPIYAEFNGYGQKKSGAHVSLHSKDPASIRMIVQEILLDASS